MDQHITTPRFVTCIEYNPEDGNIKQYTWDKEKITVEGYLVDDLLMLQNVFEGKIISPSVYPLIYDTKSANKEISLRSLEFYREVAKDNSLYETLSKEDKIYFLVGLRDLFVASCRHLLSQEEQDLLIKITNLVDPNDEGQHIVCKKINNIEVTPYPTCRNKLVQFVDEKSESIEDEYFIRNELNLLLCFVDPQDLSYHNFENIINLDSVFKQPHEFSITNIQKEANADVYTFDLLDKTKILASLNEYNLYVEPLNKLSRGGQRFIFSSEKLSNALTTSIISADFNKEHLITEKFKFVNYVFRYNKFRPTDKKFSSHFDTPYYDPAKKHYSKYTIIFYLTSGQADPVLSINKGKVKIDKIDASGGKIKGVIFDQRYEHEGKSFIDGDKIFLRSELVFEYGEEDGFTFDEEISKKFNIGCYMTKQSVFNSEVEKYASDCFNQAAEARFRMSKAQTTHDILLCKQYRDTVFVTNGYDYWFTKDTSLKEAAILVLLDSFNCKFESGEAFNKLTYQFVMPMVVDTPNQIFGYLTELHQTFSMNNEESKQVENHEKKDVSYDEPLESACCTSHCSNINPKRNYYVRVYLEQFRARSNEKLQQFKNKFAISLFDQQIEINENNIVISDNIIKIDNEMPNINFASCWNHNAPADFIAAEDHMGYTSIPPVWYQTSDEGHHLKIELFHNGFVRKQEKRIKKFYIADGAVREGEYDPIWSDSSRCEENHSEEEEEIQDSEENDEDDEEEYENL